MMIRKRDKDSSSGLESDELTRSQNYFYLFFFVCLRQFLCNSWVTCWNRKFLKSKATVKQVYNSYNLEVFEFLF